MSKIHDSVQLVNSFTHLGYMHSSSIQMDTVRGESHKSCFIVKAMAHKIALLVLHGTETLLFQSSNYLGTCRNTMLFGGGHHGLAYGG